MAQGGWYEKHSSVELRAGQLHGFECDYLRNGCRFGAPTRMHENELAQQAVDVAYHIHSKLGPGLFESVYCRLMAYELAKRGLAVQLEVPIPLLWEEVKLEVGFRADLVVESKLIIEVKS